MELLIRFTDQSASYTHGVEFGRILAKMEMGITVVGNCGFPIVEANRQVIEDACNTYGYTADFKNCPVEGWVCFTATKNEKRN